VHAERVGDALLHEEVEGHAAGVDFHEAAEDVGGDGVVRLLAGLGHQRHGAGAVGHLGQGRRVLGGGR
jgi:hypothetical protein